jgi:hypothetical protein
VRISGGLNGFGSFRQYLGRLVELAVIVAV